MGALAPCIAEALALRRRGEHRDARDGTELGLQLVQLRQ